MSEQTDALAFGPQWIRDLSNGSNVCVPPPSPGPTYKLAQFRYGKEEMLALFATQSMATPPVINSEIGEYILTKDISQPLSYMPMSEEEQQNQFGSLNSAAVLKILGRGGRGGGRGSTRGGRGSGRGRGEGGFHRGFSVDETATKGEDASWQHTASRRLSWGENGRGGYTERGTREAVEASPRGFELSAPPGRHKEASRALSSGNWRSSDSAEADDDGGGWTVSGSRGSERAEKWRGSTRGGRHNSAEDYNVAEHGAGDRWSENWNRGSRDRNSFDDLPEWSKSDNVFEPDLGSFDSSGAFCVVKDKKKFDDTGQSEAIDDKDQKEDWENELTEDSHGTPVADSKIDFHGHNKDLTKEDITVETEKLEELQENKTDIKQEVNAVRENKLTTHPKEIKSNIAPAREEKAAGIKPRQTASEASQRKGRNTSGVDSQDKVGADLERVAESCIAKLNVECEDLSETQVRASSVESPSAGSDGDKQRSSPTEDETRWFYRDPQGQEQGPFRSEEMVEWFHHGYFTMQLSIRRQCDVLYLPLGEVIKRWQRVPFLPGPAPPPITHQHVVNQQTMFMQQQLLQQHYEDLQKHAILQQIQQQQQQQTTHSVSPSGAAELIWGPESTSPKNSWSPASNTTGVWDQSSRQKSPVPSAEEVQRLEEEKAKAEAEKKETELMASKRNEEEKIKMLKKEEEERLQREAVLRENELRLKKQKEEEEKERRRQEIQKEVEAEKRKDAAKQKKKAQQEQKQRKESEEQKQKQNEIRDQQKQALMRLQQQQQQHELRREQQIQDQDKAEQKKLERQIQEEENAQQLQQHLQQKRMQSNSGSKWGRQSPPTLSLSVIQEQEEINRRAHQERMQELEARQRELQSVATASHGWADNQSNSSSVKSLKAIQDEQSRQLRTQKKNKPVPRSQPAPVSPSGAWANSWTAGNNNVWSGMDLADDDEHGEKDTGFWAEAGRAVSAKSHSQPEKQQARVSATQSEANGKKSGKKATKEEESVRRIFQQSGDNDPFAEWCTQSLYGIQTSVHIPTFIAFLKEVESPYEIHSYVNDFLGDSNQAKVFAKEFIQKKASLCASEKRTTSTEPVPTSTEPVPTAVDVVPRGGGGANRTLPQNEAELKENSSAGNGKNKKKKKQRMQKVDPSILGFSVNAAAERVNMGEIQSVDDS